MSPDTVQSRPASSEARDPSSSAAASHRDNAHAGQPSYVKDAHVKGIELDTNSNSNIFNASPVGSITRMDLDKKLAFRAFENQVHGQSRYVVSSLTSSETSANTSSSILRTRRRPGYILSTGVCQEGAHYLHLTSGHRRHPQLPP